jgi:hypothetical protein
VTPLGRGLRYSCSEGDGVNLWEAERALRPVLVMYSLSIPLVLTTYWKGGKQFQTALVLADVLCQYGTVLNKDNARSVKIKFPNIHYYSNSNNAICWR